LNIGFVALLILFVGATVSILSTKLKVAYTTLLVLVGLVVSIVYHAASTPAVEPTGELIISVVLPPLIFQAGLTMHYAVFRKVQGAVVLLAVVGVVVSVIVCSLIVGFLTPLSLIAALAFGVIISPTDAAAVIDTLKKVKAPKELGTIIEGEALLNDATALALFSAVSALTLNPLTNAIDILVKFGGGAIVGLALAFISTKLIAGLSDKNAQVMISIGVAYGSFMLASVLGFSGIVAVAVLGLYIGRYYQTTESEESQNGLMIGFWNVAAFIANTAAFTFIGLACDAQYLLQYGPLIVLSFLAVLVARYVSIEAVLVPARKFAGAIPRSWRNIASLAGIRGAVSAALALSLPEFPFKGVIVAVTFGVVLLSLLVQTRLLSYYVGKVLK